jgi:hypothetical protein
MDSSLEQSKGLWHTRNWRSTLRSKDREGLGREPVIAQFVLSQNPKASGR